MLYLFYWIQKEIAQKKLNKIFYKKTKIEWESFSLSKICSAKLPDEAKNFDSGSLLTNQLNWNKAREVGLTAVYGVYRTELEDANLALAQHFWKTFVAWRTIKMLGGLVGFSFTIQFLASSRSISIIISSIQLMDIPLDSAYIESFK